MIKHGADSKGFRGSEGGRSERKDRPQLRARGSYQSTVGPPLGGFEWVGAALFTGLSSSERPPIGGKPHSRTAASTCAVQNIQATSYVWPDFAANSKYL